jgi:hypothetical protein
MTRYIKKLTRIGSMGPSEERGYGLWVGYELDVDGDLSAYGLTRADALTEAELAARGITTFIPVTPESLGIERKT